MVLLHMAAAVYYTLLVHVHSYFLRKEQDSVKFTFFANVYKEDQADTAEKSITWMRTVLLGSAYDNNKKYNTWVKLLTL